MDGQFVVDGRRRGAIFQAINMYSLLITPSVIFITLEVQAFPGNGHVHFIKRSCF